MHCPQISGISNCLMQEPANILIPFRPGLTKHPQKKTRASSVEAVNNIINISAKQIWQTIQCVGYLCLRSKRA